jgi:large subunit ribosomal protein L24
MKLKLNDNVIVIAGKDKGKTGKVTKVLLKENKVIVAGVNKFKRHLKRRDQNTPGGVVEIERPIQASNVMLFINNKPTRKRVAEVIAAPKTTPKKVAKKK